VTEKDFITTLVKELRAKGIKKFPDDFCDLSDSMVISSPGQNMVLGNNILGYYEVTTTDGDPVFNLESLNKAKFIVYSSRNMTGEIIIPNSETEINNAVRKYEVYLDEILNSIKEEYKKFNPDSRNTGTISSTIFMKLNLTRI
jgi:hypothetical protein